MLGLNDDTQVIGRRAHDLFHYANERGKPNPLQHCALQHAYETGEELRDWQTHFWHFDEKPLPVECTVRPLRAQNKLEGTVVAFRDIAERKRLEDELMWQANHDTLTKLHNRRYFENYLENEVARIQRSNESSALLYIDLDRFKYINDTAGHTAGDQLLIEISKQLKTRLRDTDLLARLGGDEFAIIMRNTNTENIQGASEAFREVLEQYSFAYESKQYQVNGSIGVALIDRDITSAGDVLANADIACHIAKSRGRNQTHIYQPENDEKVVMNLDLGWSERLQSALKQDSFQLLFQPIIPVRNLDTECLPVGDGEIWQEYKKEFETYGARYEVLLRLVSKSGELISPNAFLPTAERFGIMPQLDIWVLKNALKKLADLHRQGQRTHFTVNISGETMEPERLIQTLTSLLDEYHLDASFLTLEITESSAIENLDAAKALMNELRIRGCHFALDDFGSGFSSFNHLKHLPVDYVKIDGQFVRGMAQDPTDRAIVASINEIAHSFGKQTIAEFVENPEILNQLKKHGVDYAQGYYISPPLRDLTPSKIATIHKIHSPLSS